MMLHVELSQTMESKQRVCVLDFLRPSSQNHEGSQPAGGEVGASLEKSLVDAILLSSLQSLTFCEDSEKGLVGLQQAVAMKERKCLCADRITAYIQYNITAYIYNIVSGCEIHIYIYV